MRTLFFIFCLFFSMTGTADRIAAAKIHAELGLIYLSKGFYIQAKRELVLAIEEDPHHAVSWNSMAYYLEKTGDIKIADAYYQKALQLEPDSGAAKNNYGAFLYRERQYHQALSFFLAAVKAPHYTNATGAYSNAGLSAIAMDDVKSAKRYFKQALLKDPRNSIAIFYAKRLKMSLAHE